MEAIRLSRQLKASERMKRPLLYSTNTYLKYRICRDFRGNVHHAWCTDMFDSDTLDAYEAGSGLPPTSNPFEIYWDLKRAIEEQDRHNAKILGQRKLLNDLAEGWRDCGEIESWQWNEIRGSIESATLKDWTPLVYVIPRVLVKKKTLLVPVEKRASLEWEYEIKDLKRSEFDIIELTRS